MVMRRTRRGRLKRQKNLIIIGSFSVLLFLSVGYAAFSTTVKLNAKGNVHPAPTYTVNQLKATALTEGTVDGLYVDSAEQGRYVFKGGNPNNYLTLNGETWRIMSIEADNTLKIIKEDSIGTFPFDLGRTSVVSGITENGSDDGTRHSTISTDFCYYSSDNFGCKVWGSKDTMRDSNGILLKDTAGGAKIQRILSNEKLYDLPEDEAYLNVYLNGGMYAGIAIPGWYNTWSSTISDDVKKYIIADHSYNVGLVAETADQLIGTDIDQEKNLTWKGRVGLVSVSEYVRASINPECTGVYAYRNNSECYNDGATHNYLRKTVHQWTLSPYSLGGPNDVWPAKPTNLGYATANSSYAAHPVLYLSSDVKLKGDGTTDSKFEIR